MIDVIDYQIMWSRLIAVVEEEAQALIRTAFGTATREAGDLSAGVYDVRGNLIAQAVTGTPGHVNSMAKTVGHVLRKFPAETMRPGDVFITNDPWLGTGHLNDVVVVTPAFRRDALVGFFACTLHVVDIGGTGGGASRQVYEEGLCLPIVRLAEGGRISETVLDIVRANVREPVQVVGDIYSEVTANEVGCRKLAQMMDEFALETLDDLAAYILDRSREASLARIRALPAGTYESAMEIDGIDQPITLKARLHIRPDGIDIEYFDCPGLAQLGYNVPYCYAEAYTCFGLRCAIAPDVPNNAGSLGVIRVHIPEGTMLNAPHPAPVQSRALIGQMLPDLVFGCLAQVIPDKVMAEGSARLWSMRFTGGLGRVKADPHLLRDARRFNVASFHSGGTGARFGQDGLSATAFPSGVRNIPVELTETYAPVVIRRKELRMDSGGAGRQRGGLGQVMEVTCTEPVPFAVVTSFDRMKFPARGRDGGLPGAQGTLRLASGRDLPGKGYHQIDPGDRLIVEMPGGGGYHDPLSRAPEQVAADVRDELVSRAQAEALYGVVIGDNGEADVAATEIRRRELSRRSSPPAL
ncbi:MULTISPECIES: hydantoinase B/oxoprolinase family protein [unclassified Chelatococcus]|uniref:hydantoinase B/oxoprolinase family protein n=1 Tax=unclassified Chelatococcus TaxID=2638111 RepID=UPI001BD04CC9|nr:MULTISPECIES: hydantoinase B/oxoprolinase family protein [unclassified Chelatococcus]MBS7696701.1 hydantoinase B/oxoprolinase family protein [Chelatococcus sp. YT9]MBX3555266.1 hydantoinase B/oxoprolinase family protein [Chelatococcus sp.]